MTTLDPPPTLRVGAEAADTRRRFEESVARRSEPPVVRSALELVGGSPMVELTRFAAEELGQGRRADLFAKLEWLTPGGSVKDRAGLGMVLWAEAEGRLRPGGTIVEPTAGNTGIGLALAGVLRGYEVILVVPEGYAIEKIKLMQSLGATVERSPKADGIRGAIARVRQIEEELGDAFVPMQWENEGNSGFHELTTAEEIRRQMEDRIDAVVIGVGTGGTFTGVCRALRRLHPDLLCVAVETNGSVLQGGEPGPHEVEGIGTSFIPEILDRRLMDEVIMVHDDDSFATAKLLARSEGLLVGGSSGANAFAALQVARRLGPGRRIVTIFPDSAERYLSKGRLGGP
ncbi:MAG: cysteine synthase family protein [Thermoanaerobaculia bacterium]|nr:cysteine synthase family protein [Thermoanaerobaculia bacterium]